MRRIEMWEREKLVIVFIVVVFIVVVFIVVVFIVFVFIVIFIKKKKKIRVDKRIALLENGFA